MANEFNDRPFVAGSLIGLRHVKMGYDEEGHHLVGPHAGYRYRPGENIGKCDVFRMMWAQRKRVWDRDEHMKAQQHREQAERFRGASFVSVSREDLDRFDALARNPKLNEGLRLLNRNFVDHYGPQVGYEPPQKLITVTGPTTPYEPQPFPEPEPTEADHRVGSANCTCGFYAYFEAEGSHMFGKSVNMGAIVEGYGVVTVGSRGFRCEKLRHLALIASWDAVSTEPWEQAIKRRDRDRAIDLYSDEISMGVMTAMVERHFVQEQIAIYMGVPLFNSLDQALAEYPLTRPPEEF